MFMLYNNKDAGVYLPIVTGIVGAWLPSPHLRDPTHHAALQSQNVYDIEQPLIQPLIQH
jgi:hypothetical protein